MSDTPMTAPTLPEPRPDDEGREAELPAHVTPALRSRFRRWANRLRGRYGVPIYLCGSALREDNPDPRDWDIRLMLPDEDFDIRFGPVSEWIEEGRTGNWTRTRFRWSDQCVKDTKDFAAWCLLNGDVQIYPESHATALYGREPRVRIDSFPDDEAALTPHLASLGATDTGRYVPGKWVCPTCGFVQAMLTINAHSGAVSASAERALPCPNDGQYMERQTWEAHARDLEAMLVAALDRERSAPLGATDEGLRPVKWEAVGGEAHERVYVEEAEQRDGTRLYAVRQTGSVLGRDGEWLIMEPLPSSRDEAYIAAYRFATIPEAVAALRAALQAGG